MGIEKHETSMRREQIAEAALSLAAAGGLGKLSVAAVARRVGFVPSAVYRHFKSKDQMLDAALGLIQKKLRANVQAVCGETGDPVERLQRLLRRHVQMIRENQGIPRVIFSEDFYNGHPERRRRVYTGIRTYLGDVAEIIREGQHEGKLGNDFAAETAAVMFLGLVQPSAILWHMSDGEFDVTGQAEKAWRIFLKAIQKTSAIRQATP